MGLCFSKRKAWPFYFADINGLDTLLFVSNLRRYVPLEGGIPLFFLKIFEVYIMPK